MVQKYLMLADGHSVHTYKWAKELMKQYDLYIFSFCDYSVQLKDLLPEQKLFRYSTKIEPNGGNIHIIFCLYALICILKKVNPIIINAHYITSYGTVAYIASMLTGFKGKIVMSAYGSDILSSPKNNKAYYFLTRWLLQKADYVTSDSLFMTDMIHLMSKETHVITFPFGVEYMPDISADDKDDLLFFSNRILAPNYNIERVIMFFHKQWMIDNDRKLFIANDGTEKNNLIELVNILGIENSVQFVGYLSEKEQAEYYKRCRYYISLPKSDSTSVSLLEAMSYGCVPIVSDIPANREWVMNGGNGIVLDRDDKVDLNAINKSLAFIENRNIIIHRAIWKDNIKTFINHLN